MTKSRRNETAKKVRDLRSKLGLTQEQFAAAIGVSYSTANRWESGKSKPSPLAQRRMDELIEDTPRRDRSFLHERSESS